MKHTGELKPYRDLPSGKKEQVTMMFDRIAPWYDFLNHLFSFSIDRCWRRTLVRHLARQKPAKILDVAAGTGDLSLLAARKLHAHIVATDISEEMLRIARHKILKKGLQGRVNCMLADAEAMPFDANTFDAAMVAFGVRNFQNPDTGLKEMYRVVKPGGAVAVLEFSIPSSPLFRSLYLLYFRRIIPFFGRLISGDSQAYSYLNKSAEAFPQGEKFCQMLREAGFSSVAARPVSWGIARLYTGTKPFSHAV